MDPLVTAILENGGQLKFREADLFFSFGITRKQLWQRCWNGFKKEKSTTWLSCGHLDIWRSSWNLALVSQIEWSICDIFTQLRHDAWKIEMLPLKWRILWIYLYKPWIDMASKYLSWFLYPQNMATKTFLPTETTLTAHRNTMYMYIFLRYRNEAYLFIVFTLT